MHQKFTLVIVFCFLAAGVSAKVWRVNNVAGISADFNNLSTAISSASVVAGDTLYVEPSASAYGGTILNKRLVLIGGGYFLSGATGNAGLQFNNVGTSVTQITCALAASGSTIIGIDTYVALGVDTDDITIKRCNIILFSYNEATPPNPVAKNLVVHQCYLDMRLNTAPVETPVVTNCIVSGSFDMSNVVNGLVRNNTFRNISPRIYNSYVANNIITNAGTTLNMVNCAIRYNIATSGLLPADPALHNTNNVSAATLFIGTGSTDGQVRLATGGTNPAIAGGEPVNGVTPDAGAFGTADPYRLSGIAPIPAIYSLTVPASIPSSATTIDITISTRANN